jgi:carbon storage regulator
VETWLKGKEGSMLVLSRKRGEGVLIGDGIRISVIKLERNQVRLGIEAPGSVTILREELVLENGPEGWTPVEPRREMAVARGESPCAGTAGA